ncbi:unnamed protein product [Effrenium voratum]|uniref:Uncharacterized protein n=1 Tax=Effrenium voratum TaxID=2562239 RepID=A0AA36IR05_9DINO|nr:unnamed protein product [Effrenium voratum]
MKSICRGPFHRCYVSGRECMVCFLSRSCFGFNSRGGKTPTAMAKSRFPKIATLLTALAWHSFSQSFAGIGGGVCSGQGHLLRQKVKAMGFKREMFGCLASEDPL